MARRRGSKYHNRWTEYNGRNYHSKTEAARAMELDMLVRSGDVLDWTPQPKFELGPAKIKCVMDFYVHSANDGAWVEDVKGAETDKFKILKKLWAVHGPCPLHILKRSGRTWKREVIEVQA